MRDSVHGSVTLVLPTRGSLEEPGPEMPHLSLSKAQGRTSSMCQVFPLSGLIGW